MKRHYSPQEVTQLLHLWRRGEQSALDELVPLVHDELHRRAHRIELESVRGNQLVMSK